MKRMTLLVAIAAMAMVGSANADLVITGVIDGDLSGGSSKTIVLTATANIADLSIYGIGSANNGQGTGGEEFPLSGSVMAGDQIVIVVNTASTDFFANCFSGLHILQDSAASTGDRAAAINAFNSEYLPSLSVPNGWTGTTSSCNPGTNSSAYQQASEDMINYFRGMTGLPSISLDPALEAETMSAALMMQANSALSHFPPSTWDCYTTTGSSAAGSSNLYLGVTGPAAMAGYIRDPGAGNTAVGHRRWILYPRMLTMGSGSTSNANALKVFGGAGQWGTRPTSPDWVSWPPAGFVPLQVVYPRWSLSSNEFPSADFSAAVVTMTADGVPVTLNQNSVSNGFGDNTLVWEPQGISPSNNQIYSVTVSNILIDSSPVTHSYEVTAIDPAAGSSGPGINGDDAVELFQNGVVIDTYGDVNVIGDGETWEYTDGFAVRTGGNAGAFNQDNYDTRVGALDGLDETQQKTALANAFGFTPVSQQCVLGDVDLNGTVNFADIAPFIAVLSGATFQCEADCDENGMVDFSDIAPFITILSSP